MAAAELLINETFDYPEATQLNGQTAPGTASAPWTAARQRGAETNGYRVYNNALQGRAYGSRCVGGANLGAGYIAANPGVYTLSADVYFSTNFASRNWQMGFSVTTSNNGGINRDLLSTDAAKGYGGSPVLALYKSGALQFKRYRNNDSATTLAAAGTYPAGTEYTLKLVLDNTGPEWTVDAYINGAQLDVSGSGSDGTDTFTYTNNPTGIRYASLGSPIQPSDNTATNVSYMDNLVLEYVIPQLGGVLLIR
jgi:hypothetical protein